MTTFAAAWADYEAKGRAAAIAYEAAKIRAQRLPAYECKTCTRRTDRDGRICLACETEKANS